MSVYLLMSLPCALFSCERCDFTNLSVYCVVLHVCFMLLLSSHVCRRACVKSNLCNDMSGPMCAATFTSILDGKACTHIFAFNNVAYRFELLKVLLFCFVFFTIFLPTYFKWYQAYCWLSCLREIPSSAFFL